MGGEGRNRVDLNSPTSHSMQVGEVAHDALEKAKPVAEKAGAAVTDAAHKVSDKVNA